MTETKISYVADNLKLEIDKGKLSTRRHNGRYLFSMVEINALINAVLKGTYGADYEATLEESEREWILSRLEGVGLEDEDPTFTELLAALEKFGQEFKICIDIVRAGDDF